MAALAWAIPSLIVAIRLAWSIVRDLLAGELGVDVIAILAIGGALLLGERLAAAVIGVMLATGEALERYAQGRAHRELTALLGRAPRTSSATSTAASRRSPSTRSPSATGSRSGPARSSRSTVWPSAAPAVLDESALTGESRLVTRGEGEPVSSGTVNAGSSFDLRAIAPAAASTYAGIVRLVEEAQASKAPFVRLADRYALLFIPLTLAISAAAWLVSGDPVRGLAVLVVATPCPLLLAAPIAIVAGISRAARRGVIVKGGGPLETLARARVVLFDKTGTLTAGRPRLGGIEVGPADGASRDRPGRPGELDQAEILRLAASVEQLSPHVLAGTIVHAARERGLDLAHARRGRRDAGRRRRRAGSRAGPWPSARPSSAPATAACRAGRATSGDAPRSRARRSPSSASTARSAGRWSSTTRSGPRRRGRSARCVGPASAGSSWSPGDSATVADIVGSAIGVDAVLAERAPGEKVDAVRMERVRRRRDRS